MPVTQGQEVSFGDPELKLSKGGGFAIVKFAGTFEVSSVPDEAALNKAGWSPIELCRWDIFPEFIRTGLRIGQFTNDIMNIVYIIPLIDDTFFPHAVPIGGPGLKPGSVNTFSILGEAHAYKGGLLPFPFAFSDEIRYGRISICIDVNNEGPTGWFANGAGLQIRSSANDAAGYDVISNISSGTTVVHGHGHTGYLGYLEEQFDKNHPPTIVKITCHADQDNVNFSVDLKKPDSAANLLSGGFAYSTPDITTDCGTFPIEYDGQVFDGTGSDDQINEFQFIPFAGCDRCVTGPYNPGVGLFVWNGTKWVCKPLEARASDNWKAPQDVFSWNGSKWVSCTCGGAGSADPSDVGHLWHKGMIGGL